MRGTYNYYPALVRVLIETAEGQKARPEVLVALALNRDIMGDCPSGPLWEYSFGYLAAQSMIAEALSATGEFPREWMEIIEHLAMTLDTRVSGLKEKSVQALERASEARSEVAFKRLWRDTDRQEFDGLIPALTFRANGGEVVLKPYTRLVRAAKGTVGNFTPAERAIIVGALPMFGADAVGFRVTVERILKNENDDRLVLVTALVKLLTWYAAEDLDVIRAVDRDTLEQLTHPDPVVNALITAGRPVIGLPDLLAA